MDIFATQAFEAAVDLVRAEYAEATENFGPFASRHEGIAILREEYLELEREVFHGTPEAAVIEAKQVAAMAIRFMVNCCGVSK